MEATGIVRHVDDLGRAIIPKKIRQTLRLWKGVFLESAGCSAKTTPIPAMKRDGRGAVCSGWEKQATFAAFNRYDFDNPRRIHKCYLPKCYSYAHTRYISRHNDDRQNPLDC